jgi:hypothetical protein
MKPQVIDPTYLELFNSLDPRSLEVIADEVEKYPYGEMRARSLRKIAANQRAVMEKLGELN